MHYCPESAYYPTARLTKTGQGDAAGLAERLLGEGIYFAVKSGQQAALSILESGECTMPAGDLYQKKLKQIQADLRMSHFGSKWFYRFPWISLKAMC